MSAALKLCPRRLPSPFIQNLVAGIFLPLEPGRLTARPDSGAGGSQATNTKASRRSSACAPYWTPLVSQNSGHCHPLAPIRLDKLHGQACFICRIDERHDRYRHLYHLVIDSTLLKWTTDTAYAFAIQAVGITIFAFLCFIQATDTN
ncbi:hypothetical protein BCR39DRAFT_597878 [Naematelia encephala]|uniref:Uncharacterized protein n=1 Tax=Naematelia encephala TaxID=71784 RepID=A0A1Y2BB25_9TREE|nr:hypothetical protein BCR39DRAFT_597878 [Naematelia encephala]